MSNRPPPSRPGSEIGYSLQWKYLVSSLERVQESSNITLRLKSVRPPVESIFDPGTTVTNSYLLKALAERDRAPSEFEVELTNDEYDQLGRPALLDFFTFTLKKEDRKFP